MKILPPTLRESSRYLAFSLTSEDDISRKDLVNEILYSASTLFGDVGSSQMGLRLLAFQENKGIIQCSTDRIWEVRAVLASVFSVKGIRARIRILGISGTVLAATEKYLQGQNKKDAEPERKITKENKIIIENRTIFGSIVNKENDEINLLPEDSLCKEILNRSNTKYLGITVFDLEDKEIDL